MSSMSLSGMEGAAGTERVFKEPAPMQLITKTLEKLEKAVPHSAPVQQAPAAKDGKGAKVDLRA